MNVILSIFLGWILERAQMIICAPNYGAMFNGYGVIDLVNRKDIKAPMAYRVLAPWLVRAFENIFHSTPKQRIGIYQTIKWALNSLMFYAVMTAWGVPNALLTGLLLLLTFKYDYWDWAVELAAIAFAVSGNPWLTLFGVILLALSRETAPLVPVIYLFVTKDLFFSGILMANAIVWMAAVRIIVGKKPLYCKRWMIRENWTAVKEIFKYLPFYHGEVFISIVLSILAVSAVIGQPKGWIAVPVLLAAGWTMAKADETRVFSSVIPWVAAWILKGLA